MIQILLVYLYGLLVSIAILEMITFYVYGPIVNDTPVAYSIVLPILEDKHATQDGYGIIHSKYRNFISKCPIPIFARYYLSVYSEDESRYIRGMRIMRFSKLDKLIRNAQKTLPRT